jgi:hypothetical protein
MKDLFPIFMGLSMSMIVYSLCLLVPPLVKVVFLQEPSAPHCKPIGRNGSRCDDGNTYWR